MNASERLSRAREIVQEGRFAEALAEYEWFHHNALAEDRALRGVRRSFALAYWAELGEKYPPARDALTALRDRGYRALLGGNRDRGLFADVAAINRYLCDETNTYHLFLSLDAMSVDFAAECFGSAISPIVRAADFRLARKYIPEPEAALAALLADFNDSVDRSLRLQDKRHRTLRLQAETSNFVSDVQLLLAVTKSTDGVVVTETMRRTAILGISEELLRKRAARKLAT